MEYKLKLDPSMFSIVEKPLIEGNDVTVSTFTYSTGVEALRVKTGRGEFVWLPFLAQEIWSWKLDGIEQKFEGFIKEPSYEARNFTENYGGFLIHCGITAMGNPATQDDHPQHGELPIARYKDAWLEFSEGDYPVSLCGTYEHIIPFFALYSFSPALRIHKDGTSIFSDNRLENLQKTPLNYMYLNHINFSMNEVERLEYGVEEFSKESVHVLDDVVPGVQDDPRRFLKVNSDMVYDPELVAIMKNKTSDDTHVVVNKAYKSDGTVLWNAIDAKGLDHTVVWLTQTPDRSACGFSLPATAGPRGLLEEAKLGNMKCLDAREIVRFKFIVGAGTSEHTIKDKIITLEVEND